MQSAYTFRSKSVFELNETLDVVVYKIRPYSTLATTDISFQFYMRHIISPSPKGSANLVPHLCAQMWPNAPLIHTLI